MSIFDNYSPEESLKGTRLLGLRPVQEEREKVAKFNQEFNQNKQEELNQNQFTNTNVFKPNTTWDIDTYAEYQHNLRKGDPNAYRTQRLQEATERNKQLLEGYKREADAHDNALRASGVDEDTIQYNRREQDKIRSLSGLERLQNYIARQQGNPNTLDDYEFAQDMQTKDMNFIKGKYGQEAASYSYELTAKKMQSVMAKAGQTGLDEGVISWQGARDIGIGVAESLVDTAEALYEIEPTRQLYKLAKKAFSDDDTVAEKEESIFDWTKAKLDSAKSSALKDAERADSVNEEYAQQYADAKEQQYKYSMSADEAKAKAKIDYELEKFSLDVSNTKTLTQSVTQMLPDMAAAITGAGLASSTAKAVLGGAIKSKLRKEAIEQGALKAGKLTEKQIDNIVNKSLDDWLDANNAIRRGGASQAQKAIAKQSDSVQDAIQQGRDVAARQQARNRAYRNALKTEAKQEAEKQINTVGKVAGVLGSSTVGASKEANDTSKQAYNNVANLSQEDFLNTNAGKKSAEKVAKDLGMPLNDNTLLDGKFKTALRQEQLKLAKKAESDTYQQAFAGSFGSSLLTGGFENRAAGVSELSKGFKNKLKDKVADTTKEAVQEFYESHESNRLPNKYANEVLGSKIFDEEKNNLSSGLLGAITAGLGTGGISTLPLGKSALKTAKNKATSVIQNQTQKLESKSQAKEAENIQSVFGTSSGVKNGVQREATKGVLGKTFDETNFGTSYKTAVKQLIDKNTIFKDDIEKIGEHNYTQIIDNMQKKYAKAQEILANPNSSEQDKATASAVKVTFEAFQQDMTKGITQDIFNHSDKIENKYNEVLKHMDDMRTAYSNQDVTALQEAQAKAQQANTELQELMQNNKEISALMNTTLYKQLSPENNSRADEIAKLKRDNSFLDNKNKENYPKVYNRVSSGIQEVATQLKEGKITEEEGIAKFQEAIQALHAVKNDENTSSEEKLEHFEQLIGTMKNALSSIGREFHKDSVFAKLDKALQNNRAKGNKDNTAFIQKFFGGKGVGAYSSYYKMGLLDYANNMINSKKDNNVLPLVDQFMNFRQSQIDKTLALQEMIAKMRKENPDIKPNQQLPKAYSYNTKFSTLEGKKNSFTTINQAEAYLRQVQEDEVDFNDLFEGIKSGITNNKSISTQTKKDSSSEPTEKTKSEPKQENKNTNKKDNSIKENSKPVDSKQVDWVDEDVSKQSDQEAVNTLAQEAVEPNKPIDSNKPVTKDFTYNKGTQGIKLIPVTFVDEISTGTSKGALAHSNPKTKQITVRKGITEAGLNLQDFYAQEEIPTEGITIEDDNTNTVHHKELQQQQETIKQSTEETSVVQEPIAESISKSVLENQAQSYDLIKNHAFHAFMEMSDESIENYRTPDDTYIKVTLPIDERYKTKKNQLNKPKNSYTAIHDNNTATISVPPKLVEHLLNLGFSFEENIFETYVSEKPTALSVALDDSTITALLADKNPFEEQGLANPNDTKDMDFNKGISSLIQGLRDYFRTKDGKGNNRHWFFNFSKVGAHDRLTSFTTLMNLLNIKETSRLGFTVRMSKNVFRGFLGSIIKTSIEASTRGSSHDTLTEHYAEKGQIISNVYNITEGLKTKYYNQIITKKGISDEYLSKQPINTITRTQKDFVKDLGRNLLDVLGLSLHNAPVNAEEAMTYSLGYDIYQFMLKNNLIQQYTLELVDNNGNTSYENYIGFTQDSITLPNNITDSINTLKDVTATKENKSKASKTLEKYNPVLLSLMQILTNDSSDLATNIFGDLKQLHGVQISSIKAEKQTATTESKGADVRRSDTNSKLTTGNNPVAQQAIETANNVPFAVDMDMHQILSTDENLLYLLQGGVLSVNDVNHRNDITEESKEALLSRKSRVDRSFNLMKQYFHMAQEQVGNLTDAVFRFAHKISSNSRVMMDSDLNPNSDKIVREMLNPIEFKVGEDSEGTLRVKGTIQPKFKLGKVKNPRTIQKLIKDIKRYKSKPDTKSQEQYNTLMGFALALAQATGIKVEKQTEETILKNLVKKLDTSETASQEAKDLLRLGKLLYDIQQSGNKAKHEDYMFVQQMYNKYGTASSRLAKTMLGFAKYQYQNVEGHDVNIGKRGNSNMSMHLYLEADGIANGFFNIIKQFATEFRPSYVEANKRTGNLTLDVLSNLKQKVEEDLGRPLTEEEFSNIHEGSRTLFESEGIRDMYQNIADTAHDMVRNINFGGILQENNLGKDLVALLHNSQLNLFSKSKLITNTQDMEESPYTEFVHKVNTAIKKRFPSNTTEAKNNRKMLRDSINTSFNNLRILGQIIAVGGIENKSNSAELFMRTVFSNNFNLDTNMIADLTRGLAKLGVTPAMYGGKVKGVSNQILTSLKPELLKHADKYLGLVAVRQSRELTETEKVDLQTAYRTMRITAMVLGIPSGMFADKFSGHNSPTQVSKIISGQTNLKEQKSLVDGLMKEFKRNNKKITYIITQGLGKFLSDIIQDTYKNELNGLETAIAANEYLFQAFIQDFTDRTEEYIRERNKTKELSATRQLEGLTRKDIKKIMRSLQTVPIVGTAYSNNTELLDSLLDYGNTLLKTEGRNDSKNVQRVSSSFNHFINETSFSPNQDLYFTETNYKSAGASANTATVPSTEAMTLNQVQQAVQRVGKAFLNVFDGLDAKFQDRFAVGQRANEETFKVHTNTNLMEDFFHMFVRSAQGNIDSIVEDLSNNNYTPRLLHFLAATLQIFAYTDRHLPDSQYGEERGKRLALKWSKALRELATEGINTELDKENAYTLVMNVTDSYRMGVQGNINNSLNQNSAPRVMLSFAIRTLADNVADNYAIRQLEKNDLSQVINQFGGNNTGYFVNPTKLNSLAERFITFKESNKEALLSDSELLSQFVKQDAELKQKYNEYFEQKRLALKENYIHHTEYYSWGEADYLQTVGDLVNHDEKYRGRETSSLGGLERILSSIFTQLSDLSMDDKIFTSLEDMYAKAKEVYKIQENTERGKRLKQDIMTPSAGKYLQGVGIYINQEEADKSVVIHELIHSINSRVFDDYYHNRNLNPKAKVAMRTIELNALKFLDTLQYSPKLRKAIEDLTKLFGSKKELKLDYAVNKYGSTVGASAALAFAFNILPTMEGVSEREIAEAKSFALNEFTAYSLSEGQMLATLQYNQGVHGLKVTDVMDEAEAKTLNAYYKKAQLFVQNLYGINKNDAYKSMLMNILGAYKVIADNYESIQENQRENSDKVFNAYSKYNQQWASELGGTSLTTEFKEHLDNLVYDIKSQVGDRAIPDSDNMSKWKLERATILLNQNDKDGINQIATLRSIGLPISNAEEQAFLLVNAANKVALENNKELSVAVGKWAEDLVSAIELSKFTLGSDIFSQVFNSTMPNKLSYILAMVSTNQALREELGRLEKEHKNQTLKDKIKQSLAYTSVYSKSFALMDNFVQMSDVLMDSVTAFNFKDGVSIEQQQRQFVENERQERKRQEVAQNIASLLGKDAGTLADALTSGQGLSPLNDDMDNDFTKAVVGWFNEYDKLKGRRTIPSTLVRWIIGATEKTHQWYKAKNQNSTLIESIRERAATTIPMAIREKFKDGLTEREEQAINDVLLPAMLHQIPMAKSLGTKEISSLLKDNKQLAFYKAQIEGDILNEVHSLYPNQKTAIEAFNVVLWQSKGLGELMVTRQAKTGNLKESHYIMPNARAVVNLLEYKSTKLTELVSALSSLNALDHVNQENRDTLAGLLDSQSQAFYEMLDSVTTMYDQSRKNNINSLLGEDGFQMNHKDPMVNIKIVKPKDRDTISNLEKRGYTLKATLPTGELVMHTNMDDSVRFTTGMFNLTESSIAGVNVTTGLSIGSYALKEENDFIGSIPNSILNQAKNNSQYYEGLKTVTTKRVVISHDGGIINTAVDLPRSLEKDLIQSSQNGIDAIGNYFGRTIEEDANIESNKQSIDLLRHHYNRDISSRKFYINFDGKVKPKSNSKSDVNFAKQLNEIYKALPYKTKEYIESTGGVMIDLREVENIAGYNQASLSDFWNDRSRLPEPIQKLVRESFELFSGVTGFNPVKSAVTAEKVLSEWASYVKDIILSRSVFIPASNLLSNILHLWTAGIPAKYITADLKEGLNAAKDYQRTENKIAQLEFLSLNHRLTKDEKAKVLAEISVLRDKQAKSPIRDLVDNGIFNSVTTLEVGSINDVDFTLLKRFQDTTGITKIAESLEGTFGKKAFDNVLIREGSATHNFMVQAMDYGDFVAKYALYKHLTQRKGINKTGAMEVIRDEFVNYTMNRGREFDWMNRVGLTWFLNYKLGIQKVIFRNLRRNFLRTLATYSVGKSIPSNILLDKTVIQQNLLWDSSLDYQTSPSNLISGLESFWMYKIFNM